MKNSDTDLTVSRVSMHILKNKNGVFNQETSMLLAYLVLLLEILFHIFPLLAVKQLAHRILLLNILHLALFT